MIKYTNISGKDFFNFSKEKRKEKPYCIIYPDGDKYWVVNNKFHREDGPAIEYIDQELDHCYYLNDIKYSFEQWCEKLNKTDEEKVFLKLKFS